MASWARQELIKRAADLHEDVRVPGYGPDLWVPLRRSEAPELAKNVEPAVTKVKKKGKKAKKAKNALTEI